MSRRKQYTSPCHHVTLPPCHNPTRIDATSTRRYGPRMELIVPDIVADVRELSAILSVMGLAIGVVLWLAGWWSHRFWFVLGFTVLGGIWGLQNAVALKSQPLVAAVGVGLAAGILALTLVRLGAFAAGGYAS